MLNDLNNRMKECNLLVRDQQEMIQNVTARAQTLDDQQEHYAFEMQACTNRLAKSDTDIMQLKHEISERDKSMQDFLQDGNKCQQDIFRLEIAKQKCLEEVELLSKYQKDMKQECRESTKRCNDKLSLHRKEISDQRDIFQVKIIECQDKILNLNETATNKSNSCMSQLANERDLYESEMSDCRKRIALVNETCETRLLNERKECNQIDQNLRAEFYQKETSLHEDMNKQTAKLGIIMQECSSYQQELEKVQEMFQNQNISLLQQDIHDFILEKSTLLEEKNIQNTHLEQKISFLQHNLSLSRENIHQCRVEKNEISDYVKEIERRYNNLDNELVQMSVRNTRLGRVLKEVRQFSEQKTNQLSNTIKLNQVKIQSLTKNISVYENIHDQLLESLRKKSDLYETCVFDLKQIEDKQLKENSKLVKNHDSLIDEFEAIKAALNEKMNINKVLHGQILQYKLNLTTFQNELSENELLCQKRLETELIAKQDELDKLSVQKKQETEKCEMLLREEKDKILTQHRNIDDKLQFEIEKRIQCESSLLQRDNELNSTLNQLQDAVNKIQENKVFMSL